MNQDPAAIAQSDREGLAPTTPPFQANSSALAVLPQIQSRLLHLAGQLDEMQVRLDQLSDSVQDNSVQLDALLGTFLTGSAGQVGDERLAELALQLEITREQVEQMHSALALVATQEQISSLARALAGHERLSDVADSVKKLGRTQFKANTLGETREQQIESALSLARELVTQRDQAHDRRSADERQRLDELRSAASWLRIYCRRWTGSSLP